MQGEALMTEEFWFLIQRIKGCRFQEKKKTESKSIMSTFVVLLPLSRRKIVKLFFRDLF